MSMCWNALFRRENDRFDYAFFPDISGRVLDMSGVSFAAWASAPLKADKGNSNNGSRNDRKTDILFMNQTLCGS